jgi:TPR repeat protein
MAPDPPLRHYRVAVVLVVGIAALGTGCAGGAAGMIVSSVASAALRTAVEQVQKNRPTPEQLWHEAQVENLERRALSGDVEAQFQIGTYYLLLQEPAAEPWICVAANRGHAKAQLQYGHWYNEDRIREDLFPFIHVTPDNSTAFIWYSLAADNGEPRAPHFRDSLIYAGMPAEQLARGRERLAAWTPQSCGVTAALTAASTPGDTAAH